MFNRLPVYTFPQFSWFIYLSIYPSLSFYPSAPVLVLTQFKKSCISYGVLSISLQRGLIIVISFRTAMIWTKHLITFSYWKEQPSTMGLWIRKSSRWLLLPSNFSSFESFPPSDPLPLGHFRSRLCGLQQTDLLRLKQKTAKEKDHCGKLCVCVFS